MQNGIQALRNGKILLVAFTLKSSSTFRSKVFDIALLQGSCLRSASLKILIKKRHATSEK